jgi:WD40 repeat protein
VYIYPMKPTRLILLALLLLCGRPLGLAAQQDWTWTFGDGVIMRFPGGGAPVVDPVNSTRYMLENVSCVSDSAGDLVFYAPEDSILRLDGSHPAGMQRLFSDDITNGSIFLPVWGQPGAYLLPSVSFSCTNVSYCPLMSTIERIGGIDTVTAYRNLGQYHPLNRATEKVAAVRDAQGTGWWLLYHGDDDNNFVRFKVDGKQASPLSLQAIGSVYTYTGTNPYSSIGEMCFSPQGDRLLAVTYTGVVDLFDFDRCTGQLNNWRALGTPANASLGPNTFYGCSFSPDGSKIYASEEGRYTGGNRLFQWDLSAPDLAASKTLIYTGPDSLEFGQHQLGPDGKIYIAQLYNLVANPFNPNNYHLSVIHDPDQPGAACNFAYDDLWLQGRRSLLSLPNLPNFNLPPLVRQVAEAGPPRLICPGDSVLIGYPDSTGGAVSYAWTGPDISTPSSATTWVRPVVNTWYYLTATDHAMGSCGVTLDSVLVRVADSADIPFAQAGTDTAVCAGGQALLGGAPAPGLVYAWTPTTGMHTPDSSATLADSVGTFVLSVTNPMGTGACFSTSDTVRVVTPPLPGFAGPDTLLCQGDSARIGLPLPPGWAALWTPASGLADPAALPAMAAPSVTTPYVLSVTDTLAAGACATASDTVLVTVEPPFDHPAPQDITYCPGEAMRVGVEALPGHTYAWIPPAGLQDPTAATTLVAPPPGGAAYTLRVTAADPDAACRTRDFPVTLTDGGCLLQNVLTPNGDGVNDKLVLGPFAGPAALSIYDRWGARVFHADAYRDDWDADGLPDGVYYYVLLVDGRRMAGHVTVLR